jgi:hypothetical protein
VPPDAVLGLAAGAVAAVLVVCLAFD